MSKRNKREYTPPEGAEAPENSGVPSKEPVMATDKPKTVEPQEEAQEGLEPSGPEPEVQAEPSVKDQIDKTTQEITRLEGQLREKHARLKQLANQIGNEPEVSDLDHINRAREISKVLQATPSVIPRNLAASVRRMVQSGRP